MRIRIGLFTSLICLIFTVPVHAVKQITIAVTQVTAHPALDAVREGFKHQLESQGFREGENLKIIYENAYGNIATANQIAYKFMSSEADVVLAITTPSAQAMVSASKDKTVPIVFSAVTDPMGASLINSFETPGEHITGTVDLPPLKDQLALMQQTMGKKILKVGVVYNSGEANSVFQVNAIKELSAKYNIQITTKVVDNSTKVLAAVQSLIPHVDAMYVPLDNIMAAAFPSVVNLCLNNDLGRKIPVFASDPEGVRQGALATIGFTHYQEGMLAGRIVSRILAGEKPGNIPVTGPEASELYINTTSAKALGIEVPKAVLKNASEVVRFE
jgi:putative tryptophan/tyrosine transport system substrate-binding protein